MRHLGRLLLLVSCCSLPANLAAQEPPQAEPDGGRKSGTYLKTGLAYWQGDIFRKGSLTQWDVDLFGTDYNLTSVSVEVESYFGGTPLQLSGFAIGYRKDTIRRIDSGHMFSGKLFRDFDLKVFALKAGGGIEWGVPSLNFDQTEFDFLADGTVRYRRTYPNRNIDVPYVGTTKDGAMYPFVELSLVQRPWVFLIETGMRIGIVKFNFDDYEVSPSGQVTQAFGDKNVLVPLLFANIGLRMF
jgi:hypothetical protein